MAGQESSILTTDVEARRSSTDLLSEARHRELIASQKADDLEDVMIEATDRYHKADAEWREAKAALDALEQSLASDNAKERD